jgi:hypothetical protein
VTGLGMTHLRGEGKPMHPDDFINEDEMTDGHYLKQLQAYKDAHGFSLDEMRKESIVRDGLLEKLK